MDRLSEPALEAALAELPGWHIEAGALQWEHTFADFGAAWAFLEQVARISEAQDHHAEIWNVYNRVRLRVWTHTVHGISSRDIAFAKALPLPQ